MKDNNAPAVAPGFEDLPTVSSPDWSVPKVVVHASEDSVTPVAGAVLWGPLLDRLNVLDEADRRDVRPIGPGGYTGGECYRALTEILIAGGDFLSDRSLLADDATQRLRGPAHVAVAYDDVALFGRRGSRAGDEDRGHQQGDDPPGVGHGRRAAGRDPDDRSRCHRGAHLRQRQRGLDPHLCRQARAAPARRERAGNAQAKRKLGSFVTECVGTIPKETRPDYQLWVRSDSASYQQEVVEAAEAADAVWSVTAVQFSNVKQVIYALQTDPDTNWEKAKGAEAAAGAEVAETAFTFAGRQVRMIVRRHRKEHGAQLSLDDVDGYRYHAIITNIPSWLGSAVDVEAHHRLRAGIPEDTIKTLKHDFGFIHAPLENFFGNWSWHLACAFAHNVALWLKVLALPESFRTCHGKRLRTFFFNLVARVTTSARRLIINLPRAYRYARAFNDALRRIRALPAFA